MKNIDNLRQMNSEELAKLLSDKCNCCIGKNKQPCGCTTCSKGIKAWLEAEVTPKLTDDEKVILRNIDKKYKWIARDYDGDLRVYSERPIKNLGIWEHEWGKSEATHIPFNNLFQFIQYDNKEPYEISKLLGE